MIVQAFVNPDLNNLLIDYSQVHNIVKFNDKCQHVTIHKKVHEYISGYNSYVMFYITNNNISICKHYIKIYTFIHKHNELVFIRSCEFGNLEVVKLLWSLNQGINIRAYNEFAFTKSCTNGHLEVVKFIWSLNQGINIHANNEHAFDYSCYHGHIEVVKFLITLYKQKNNTDYLEVLDKYPQIKKQLIY